MIPKTIHYCWFGGNELSPLAKDCIKSWEKYLPDYEIIEWNEDNFNIDSNQYVKEAYKAGRYAFVTDYVRLHALYNYGGIYMDTDVEVLKPLDYFLKHRAFTGTESNSSSVTGTMGSEKGHRWIKDLLDYYIDKKFILSDDSHNLITNTTIITKITTDNYGWQPKNELQYLKEDLVIYPFEYFCAKDFKTGKIHVTNSTYTIHHFSGSWKSKTDKMITKFIQFIGPKNMAFLQKIRQKLNLYFKKNKKGESL